VFFALILTNNKVHLPSKWWYLLLVIVLSLMYFRSDVTFTGRLQIQENWSIRELNLHMFPPMLYIIQNMVLNTPRSDQRFIVYVRIYIYLFKILTLNIILVLVFGVLGEVFTILQLKMCLFSKGSPWKLFTANGNFWKVYDKTLSICITW